MLAVGYKKVPRDGTGSSAGAGGAGGQTQTCKPGIMQSFLGFHSPPAADSDKEACGAIYEYLLTVKIVHRSRKSFERAAYSTPTEKVSHLGEKGFESSVPYSQCKKNFSISAVQMF